MHMYLRLPDGATRLLPALAADCSLTQLQAVAAAAAGLAATEFRLLLSGRALSETPLRRAAPLQTLELAPELLGGKKKKKKSSNKGKKVKRKKPKVKLAVLKMYRVEKDGRVERTRRNCRSDTCYPDTFMARHADRWACGKCGTRAPLE